MSKNDDIKKLKELNDELEFIYDLQKDIIVNFEKILVRNYQKSTCPMHMPTDRQVSSRERQKKEKSFKVMWLFQCFRVSKQAYYQRIKSFI